MPFVVKRMPLFMRFIAALTLLTFSASSITWADSKPAASVPFSFTFPEKIEVPEKWGTVQSQDLSHRDKPLVIFLQDAHAVTDAQLHIQKIIGHFQSKYQIRNLMLEGLEGKLDPTLLRVFPEKFIREKVMNSYFERGELTGAEMAAILNPESSEYQGLEDWALYEENYGAYLKAEEERPALLEILEKEKSKLDLRRAAVYSESQNEFHEQIENFNADPAYFPELLKYLAAHSEIQRLPGSLKPVLDAVLKESAPSPASLDSAIDRLAQGFRKRAFGKLQPAHQKEFEEKLQRFQIRQLDAGAFLNVLVSLGQAAGMKPKLSAEMRERLRHYEAVQHLQGGKFFEDFEDYLEKSQDAGARTPEARELVGAYKRLRLLKKLNALELSRKEYERLIGHPADALLSNAQFQPARRFYERALKRDQVFHVNLEKALAQNNMKAVLVLAGGFHSQGFETFLKENHYPYAIVTPAIKSLEGKEHYEDLMTGKISWKPEIKNTLFDGFMRHASKQLAAALGNSQLMPQMKFWRDEVIRELAKQGKLEKAGNYTKYIDSVLGAQVKTEISRTPEEIQKAARAAVESYKTRTLQSVWQDFESKLPQFMSGLKQLSQEKKMTAVNVKTLLSQSGKAKPSMLGQNLMNLNPEGILPENSAVYSAMRKKTPRPEKVSGRSESRLPAAINPKRVDALDGQASLLQAFKIISGVGLAVSIASAPPAGVTHYLSLSLAVAFGATFLAARHLRERVNAERAVDIEILRRKAERILALRQKIVEERHLVAKFRKEMTDHEDEIPHELIRHFLEYMQALEDLDDEEADLDNPMDPDDIKVFTDWREIFQAETLPGLQKTVTLLQGMIARRVLNESGLLTADNLTNIQAHFNTYPTRLKLLENRNEKSRSEFREIPMLLLAQIQPEELLFYGVPLLALLMLFLHRTFLLSAQGAARSRLNTIEKSLRKYPKYRHFESLEAVLEIARSFGPGSEVYDPDLSGKTIDVFKVYGESILKSGYDTALEKIGDLKNTVKVKNPLRRIAAGILMEISQRDSREDVRTAAKTASDFLARSEIRQPITAQLGDLAQIEQMLKGMQPGWKAFLLESIGQAGANRIFAYDPMGTVIHKWPIDAVYPPHEGLRSLLDNPGGWMRADTKNAKNFQEALRNSINPFLQDLNLGISAETMQIRLETLADAGGQLSYHLKFLVPQTGPPLKGDDFLNIPEADREAFRQAFKYWYPAFFVRNSADVYALHKAAGEEEALARRYKAQTPSLYRAAQIRISEASHMIRDRIRPNANPDLTAKEVSGVLYSAVQDLESLQKDPYYAALEKPAAALKLLQRYTRQTVDILNAKYAVRSENRKDKLELKDVQIFIADDSSSVSRDIRQQLVNAGAPLGNITILEDPEEVVSSLNKIKGPHIVLLDITFFYEDMDGYEVLDELNPRGSSGVIIMNSDDNRFMSNLEKMTKSFPVSAKTVKEGLTKHNLLIPSNKMGIRMGEENLLHWIDLALVKLNQGTSGHAAANGEIDQYYLYSEMPEELKTSKLYYRIWQHHDYFKERYERNRKKIRESIEKVWGQKDGDNFVDGFIHYRAHSPMSVYEFGFNAAKGVSWGRGLFVPSDQRGLDWGFSTADALILMLIKKGASEFYVGDLSWPGSWQVQEDEQNQRLAQRILDRYEGAIIPSSLVMEEGKIRKYGINLRLAAEAIASFQRFEEAKPVKINDRLEIAVEQGKGLVFPGLFTVLLKINDRTPLHFNIRRSPGESPDKTAEAIASFVRDKTAAWTEEEWKNSRLAVNLSKMINEEFNITRAENRVEEEEPDSSIAAAIFRRDNPTPSLKNRPDQYDFEIFGVLTDRLLFSESFMIQPDFRQQLSVLAQKSKEISPRASRELSSAIDSFFDAMDTAFEKWQQGDGAETPETDAAQAVRNLQKILRLHENEVKKLSEENGGRLKEVFEFLNYGRRDFDARRLENFQEQLNNSSPQLIYGQFVRLLQRYWLQGAYDKNNIYGFESPEGFQAFRIFVRDFLKQHPPELDIIAVAGKSGSGKTTFGNKLLKNSPAEYTRMRRVTTREQRAEEKQKGSPHRHVTRENFAHEMENGFIVLARERHGAWYGYLLEDLLEVIVSGKPILMEGFGAVNDLRQLWPKTEARIIGVLPLEFKPGMSDEEFRTQSDAVLAKRIIDREAEARKKTDPDFKGLDAKELAHVEARIRESGDVVKIRKGSDAVVWNIQGSNSEVLFKEAFAPKVLSLVRDIRETRTRQDRSEMRSGDVFKAGDAEKVQELLRTMRLEWKTYLFDTITFSQLEFEKTDDESHRERMGLYKTPPQKRIFVFDPLGHILRSFPLDEIFPEHERFNDLTEKSPKQLADPFKRHALNFQEMLKESMDIFLADMVLRVAHEDLLLHFERIENPAGQPTFNLYFEVPGEGPPLTKQDLNSVSSFIPVEDRAAFSLALEHWYPYLYAENVIDIAAQDRTAAQFENSARRHPNEEKPFYFEGALERLGEVSHFIHQNVEADGRTKEGAEEVKRLLDLAVLDLKNSRENEGELQIPIGQLELLARYRLPFYVILAAKYHERKSGKTSRGNRSEARKAGSGSIQSEFGEQQQAIAADYGRLLDNLQRDMVRFKAKEIPYEVLERHFLAIKDAYSAVSVYEFKNAGDELFTQKILEENEKTLKLLGPLMALYNRFKGKENPEEPFLLGEVLSRMVHDLGHLRDIEHKVFKTDHVKPEDERIAATLTVIDFRKHAALLKHNLESMIAVPFLWEMFLEQKKRPEGERKSITFETDILEHGSIGWEAQPPEEEPALDAWISHLDTLVLSWIYSLSDLMSAFERSGDPQFQSDLEEILISLSKKLNESSLAPLKNIQTALNYMADFPLPLDPGYLKVAVERLNKAAANLSKRGDLDPGVQTLIEEAQKVYFPEFKNRAEARTVFDVRQDLRYGFLGTSALISKQDPLREALEKQDPSRFLSTIPFTIHFKERPASFWMPFSRTLEVKADGQNQTIEIFMDPQTQIKDGGQSLLAYLPALLQQLDTALAPYRPSAGETESFLAAKNADTEKKADASKRRAENLKESGASEKELKEISVQLRALASKISSPEDRKAAENYIRIFEANPVVDRKPGQASMEFLVRPDGSYAVRVSLDYLNHAPEELIQATLIHEGTHSLSGLIKPYQESKNDFWERFSQGVSAEDVESDPELQRLILIPVLLYLEEETRAPMRQWNFLLNDMKQKGMTPDAYFEEMLSRDPSNTKGHHYISLMLKKFKNYLTSDGSLNEKAFRMRALLSWMTFSSLQNPPAQLLNRHLVQLASTQGGEKAVKFTGTENQAEIGVGLLDWIKQKKEELNLEEALGSDTVRAETRETPETESVKAFKEISRSELFRFTATAAQISAKEKAALLALIPKALLEEKGVDPEKIFWETKTESERNPQVKVQGKWILYVNRESSFLNLKLYEYVPREGTSELQENVLATVPISILDKDTLFIQGMGDIQRFDKVSNQFYPYPAYNSPKFAYWVMEVLVPLRDALGFKRIEMVRVPTQEKDLILMGFRYQARTDARWHLGEDPSPVPNRFDVLERKRSESRSLSDTAEDFFAKLKAGQITSPESMDAALKAAALELLGKAGSRKFESSKITEKVSAFVWPIQTKAKVLMEIIEEAAFKNPDQLETYFDYGQADQLIFEEIEKEIKKVFEPQHREDLKSEIITQTFKDNAALLLNKKEYGVFSRQIIPKAKEWSGENKKRLWMKLLEVLEKIVAKEGASERKGVLLQALSKKELQEAKELRKDTPRILEQVRAAAERVIEAEKEKRKQNGWPAFNVIGLEFRGSAEAGQLTPDSDIDIAAVTQFDDHTHVTDFADKLSRELSNAGIDFKVHSVPGMAILKRSESRSWKWHEVTVDKGIDTDEVLLGLREMYLDLDDIKDVLYRQYHWDQNDIDDWLPRSDFQPAIFKQYQDAVEKFNKVILNGPMTPEKLMSHYLDFHSELGKEGVVKYAGTIEVLKDLDEIRGIFEEIFSEAFSKKIKKDALRAAAHIFVALVNVQGFNDGNKRASSFILNYILMKAGFEPFILNEENAAAYFNVVLPIRGAQHVSEKQFTEFLREEYGFPSRAENRSEARTLESLALQLEKDYGLTKVRVEPVEDKNKDQVWNVKSSEGEFIFKQPRFRTTPELMDWEASVLEQLGSQRAAQIKKTVSGSNSSLQAKKLYVLYEKAEGEAFDWGGVEDDKLKQAAVWLAGMHRDLEKFVPEGKNFEPGKRPQVIGAVNYELGLEKIEGLKRKIEARGPPSLAEQVFLDEYASIESEIKRVREQLTPEILKNLPETITHGDFHQANGRFQKDGSLKVFDFEYAAREARVRELANPFELRFAEGESRDKASFAFDKIETFIKTYHQINPLTEDEIKILPAMFRLAALEGILVFAKDHGQKPESVTPLKEQIANLKQIERFDWNRLQTELRASRSEMRAPVEPRVLTEIMNDWNHHYREHPPGSNHTGMPQDMPGHLALEWRNANLETGVGSIYEFDFLKKIAKIFLADQNLVLSNEAWASKKEIEKVLGKLTELGILSALEKDDLLQAFSVVEETAAKYHKDNKLAEKAEHTKFLMGYYRAASIVFSEITLITEALLSREISVQEVKTADLEDGLEMQSGQKVYFDLNAGFSRGEYQQIGLPQGVSAADYFRVKPSRVFKVFEKSLNEKLPLSYELRKGIWQYRAEFSDWLRDERQNKTTGEELQALDQSFLRILGHSKGPVSGTLWEIYRLGLFDLYIPEMGKVRHLPSNFDVHAFTVGQHTLYNLMMLDRMADSDHSELISGKDILQELSAEELLQIRLTLLFHDLGKRETTARTEPDHAIVASRDIVPVRLAKMGVAAADSHAVAWVVRNHMMLNAFARLQEPNFSLKLPVLLRIFELDPDWKNNKRLTDLLYIMSLTDRTSISPWDPKFLDPVSSVQLNRVYESLKNYRITDVYDRPREIEDLQKEAHHKVQQEWMDYKKRNAEKLKRFLQSVDLTAYQKHIVLSPNEAGQVMEAVKSRAENIAQDEGKFQYLLERYFAGFPMDQIQSRETEESGLHLLFLIHVDWLKEQGFKKPLLFFNPAYSRTFERGYEILAGMGLDQEGIFEKTTGVLLRYGFNIEDADVQTMTNGNVIDRFTGYFVQDYPDERSHEKLKAAMTADLGRLFNEQPVSMAWIFEQAGLSYVSEGSDRDIGTEVSFLEDTNIYGKQASAFNLTTGNRLGLLHALSIVFRQHGINLVAAPVSTHPAFVNDTFYINKNGRVLTYYQKNALVSEIEALMKQKTIDLAALGALGIRPLSNESGRTPAEEFSNYWEEDLLELNKNLDKILWTLSYRGKKTAVKLGSMGLIYRALDESGKEHPSQIFKASEAMSNNGALLTEVRRILKLQEAGILSGVPKLIAMGSFVRNGGMWIKLDGIAKARSLETERFGRPTRLLNVMIRTGKILEKVHAAGMIHSDFKPGNVLINDDQEIQLNDFGHALTAGYAPLDGTGEDQKYIEGAAQGKDTDVFSFIVTLAELFDHQLQTSGEPAEWRKALRQMKDEYLKMIFLPSSKGEYPKIVEPFKWPNEKEFVQRPRKEWPQTMAPVLEKLQTDLEKLQAVIQQTEPADSDLRSDGKRNEIRTEKSNFEQAQEPEASYEDLMREGYRFEVPTVDLSQGKPVFVKISMTQNEQAVEGSRVSYYAVPSLKIILISEFFPGFPDERKGRGRALLRFLLERPEYAGYRILADRPSIEFQKSFMKMKEVNPLTRIAESPQYLNRPEYFSRLQAFRGEREKIRRTLASSGLDNNLRGLLQASWKEDGNYLYGVIPNRSENRASNEEQRRRVLSKVKPDQQSFTARLLENFDDGQLAALLAKAPEADIRKAKEILNSIISQLPDLSADAEYAGRVLTAVMSQEADNGERKLEQQFGLVRGVLQNWIDSNPQYSFPLILESLEQFAGRPSQSPQAIQPVLTALDSQLTPAERANPSLLRYLMRTLKEAQSSVPVVQETIDGAPLLVNPEFIYERRLVAAIVAALDRDFTGAIGILEKEKEPFELTAELAQRYLEARRQYIWMRQAGASSETLKQKSSFFLVRNILAAQFKDHPSVERYFDIGLKRLAEPAHEEALRSLVRSELRRRDFLISAGLAAAAGSNPVQAFQAPADNNIPASLFYGIHAGKGQFKKAEPYFDEALKQAEKLEDGRPNALMIMEGGYPAFVDYILNENTPELKHWKEKVKYNSARPKTLGLYQNLLQTYQNNKTFRAEIDAFVQVINEKLLSRMTSAELYEKRMTVSAAQLPFRQEEMTFLRSRRIPEMRMENSSFESDVLESVSQALVQEKLVPAVLAGNTNGALKAYDEIQLTLERLKRLRDELLNVQLNELKKENPKRTVLHFRGIFHFDNHSIIAGKNKLPKAGLLENPAMTSRLKSFAEAAPDALEKKRRYLLAFALNSFANNIFDENELTQLYETAKKELDAQTTSAQLDQWGEKLIRDIQTQSFQPGDQGKDIEQGIRRVLLERKWINAARSETRIGLGMSQKQEMKQVMSAKQALIDPLLLAENALLQNTPEGLILTDAERGMRYRIHAVEMQDEESQVKVTADRLPLEKPEGSEAISETGHLKEHYEWIFKIFSIGGDLQLLLSDSELRDQMNSGELEAGPLPQIIATLSDRMPGNLLYSPLESPISLIAFSQELIQYEKDIYEGRRRGKKLNAEKLKTIEGFVLSHQNNPDAMTPEESEKLRNEILQLIQEAQQGKELFEFIDEPLSVKIPVVKLHSYFGLNAYAEVMEIKAAKVNQAGMVIEYFRSGLMLYTKKHEIKKGEIGGVVHDVRNLVNNVSGYLQLLRMKNIQHPFLTQFDVEGFVKALNHSVVRQDIQELMAVLERLYQIAAPENLKGLNTHYFQPDAADIKTYTEALLQMTEDLRIMSGVFLEKVDPAPTTFSPAKIFKAFFTVNPNLSSKIETQAKPGESSHDALMRMLHPGIQIRSYRADLSRALQNLLSNAERSLKEAEAKHGRTGGSITLRLKEDKENKKVVIEIGNYGGTGFTAEEVEAVNAGKGKKSTKEEGEEGAASLHGYGLINIYEVIRKKLHGEIELKSENGEKPFAVFTITLPWDVEPESAKPSEIPSGNAGAQDSVKALVAGDSTLGMLVQMVVKPGPENSFTKESLKVVSDFAAAKKLAASGIYVIIVNNPRDLEELKQLSPDSVFIQILVGRESPVEGADYFLSDMDLVAGLQKKFNAAMDDVDARREMGGGGSTRAELRTADSFERMLPAAKEIAKNPGLDFRQSARTELDRLAGLFDAFQREISGKPDRTQLLDLGNRTFEEWAPMIVPGLTEAVMNAVAMPSAFAAENSNLSAGLKGFLNDASTVEKVFGKVNLSNVQPAALDSRLFTALKDGEDAQGFSEILAAEFEAVTILYAKGVPDEKSIHLFVSLNPEKFKAALYDKHQPVKSSEIKNGSGTEPYVWADASAPVDASMKQKITAGGFVIDENTVQQLKALKLTSKEALMLLRLYSMPGLLRNQLSEKTAEGLPILSGQVLVSSLQALLQKVESAKLAEKSA